MKTDCPDGGLQVARPLQIRVLQHASLLLACAGLVLLYLYSIHRDVPLIKINEIAPVMNFATVRVEGSAVSDAWITDSGGVLFYVQDGSGKIAVIGNRAQAEALRQSCTLPSEGDTVSVVGSLHVDAEQNTKLYLQSASQLTLDRKASEPSALTARVPLKDISREQAGHQVSIAGVLREITLPSAGSRAPYVCVLEEDGAKVEVVFWDKVFRGLGNQLPVPGKRIHVNGQVDMYRDRLQVRVQRAEDFTVEDEQGDDAG